jgi:hypothetical protein
MRGIEVAHRLFVPSSDELGLPARLAEFVGTTRQSGVDEVVIVISAGDLQALDGILEGLRPLPLPVRLLPDARLSRVARQPSRGAGKFALIDLSREPMSTGELGLKRAMDLVVAGITLLAAAPLLTVAMAAIKLDTPGPVLFRQTRRASMAGPSRSSSSGR